MNHLQNKVILPLVLIVIVALAIGVGFSYSKKEITTGNSNINTEDTGNAPTTKGFYLGEYEGKDSISYFDSGRYASGSVSLSSGVGLGSFDSSKLKNLVLVFDNKDESYAFPSPLGFAVDAKRDNLYISLVTYDPINYGVNEQNKIFKIDLKNRGIKELHSHVIGDKGYYSKGALFVKKIEADWLVLSLSSCYHCGGGDRATVLLNTQTGSEKYLGYVGDVTIKDGSVSYQKLIETTVPCEPYDDENDSTGCIPGLKTSKKVMLPSGPVIIESLI